MEGCNSGISRLGPSATTVAGSRVLEECISVDRVASALATILADTNGAGAVSTVPSLGTSGDIISSMAASVVVGSGNDSSKNVSIGRSSLAIDVESDKCVAGLVARSSTSVVVGTRGKIEEDGGEMVSAVFWNEQVSGKGGWEGGNAGGS